MNTTDILHDSLCGKLEGEAEAMIEVFRVTIPLPPMARAEPKTAYMLPKGQKAQWAAMVAALEHISEASDLKEINNLARNASYRIPETIQKGFTRHYTPVDRARHQSDVKTLLRASWRTWRASHKHLELPDLIDFPVLLTGRYYLKPPQNLLTKSKTPLLNVTIWHSTNPDWSNFQKLYEDTLQGTVLTNDSLIVGPGSGSLKLYAVPPEEPRTELILWKL